jgi:hypothetical protein
VDNLKHTLIAGWIYRVMPFIPFMKTLLKIVKYIDNVECLLTSMLRYDIGKNYLTSVCIRCVDGPMSPKIARVYSEVRTN